MSPDVPFNPLPLVGPNGQPARPSTAPRPCPRCGAGPDRRVASSGFGVPHPVCARCGHEWPDERME
jgi:hypothetical protein